MDTVLQDLRYALRTLRRSPGFTAVALLTLALGIGPTTAVYSVVEGVLLRPLPYRDPGRVVRVGWTFEQYYASGRFGASASVAEVRAWSDQNHSFDEVSPYWGDNPVLTGLGDATRITAYTVKSNLFPMLGVQPILGRGFTAEENRPGSTPVAVLSYRFWVGRFGRDPQVLGRSVTLDGTPFQIVGVMPATFRFPVLPAGFRSQGTDVWRSLGAVPAAFNPNESAELVGRLRPGVTIAQAKADLDVVERAWSESIGERRARVTVLTTVRDQAVGEVRRPLLLAVAAVGLVLVIACANAANLHLARAVARRRETAIRVALGAGQVRIVRQVLIEAVVLALAGAGVGVLLAVWGVPLLVSLAAKSLPRLDEVGINLNVLTVTVGVATLAGLLFGLVPALQSLRGISPADLKEGSATLGTSTAHSRASGAFVVAQVALTLMLLVVAGLLGRSFLKLMTLQPGFEPAHVLVAQLSLPETRYQTEARKVASAQSLMERARALPGVTSVAVSTGTPLAVGAIGSIRVPGEAEQADAPWGSFTAVTPDFFGTLGIPLHRGRLFVAGDGGSARPVIVNEALAKTFFPGQDPLGKRVSFYGGRTGTIIGVVGDTREMSLPSLPPPVIYQPLADDVQSYLKVIVRTAGDPASLVAPLRAAMRELDPDLPIDALQTMREMMAESLATERFYAALVAIFATLAVLMAAAGLYAVVSYAVARRTRELGVRIALGAEARQVLGLVVGRGAVLALAGHTPGSRRRARRHACAQDVSLRDRTDRIR
jgi:predicted permease